MITRPRNANFPLGEFEIMHFFGSSYANSIAIAKRS